MEFFKQNRTGSNKGSKNSANNNLKAFPPGIHEQTMDKQREISNVKKKIYNPLQINAAILKLLT